MMNNHFPIPKITRNFALLSAACLVIAVALVVWLVQEQRQAGDQEENFKYEAVVELQTDGFVPASLSVKKDTRVYFEAKDGKKHRLVANELYKAEKDFAKDVTVEGDGGYAYNFHTKGTYRFHDGLNPTMNGEIVVKD